MKKDENFVQKQVLIKVLIMVFRNAKVSILTKNKSEEESWNFYYNLY